MDPKIPDRTLLAPPASGGGALRAPGRGNPDPAPASRTQPHARGVPLSPDDHLVRPETREELVRGRRALAMPALPPHGDQHFRLDYVVGAHVTSGYVGSTDLLTRETEGSNFAADTCVRKAGINARTGARHIEEVAFEVVNEQSVTDVTERAEDLTTRGVRRVVAIFVKKQEVAEWVPSARAFQVIDPEQSLRDPCLERPLPVRALLDAAVADNAVAQAPVAKNNPVIAAVRSEGHAAGQLAVLARQFERRLGRPLTGPECATLTERLDGLGQDRLDDVREERSREALAAWLADPLAG